jgi:hypothetical protein
MFLIVAAVRYIGDHIIDFVDGWIGEVIHEDRLDGKVTVALFAALYAWLYIWWPARWVSRRLPWVR